MADHFSSRIPHLGGGECDAKDDQRPSSRRSRGELNFGWFSVPASGPNKERPMSRGIQPRGNPHVGAANVPMERIAEECVEEQSALPSTPGGSRGFPPPSTIEREQAQPAADVERIVQGEPTAEQDYEFTPVGYGSQAQGPPQMSNFSQPPPPTPGNTVVDWPWSLTAQEQVMRMRGAQRPPTADSNNRPQSSAQPARDIPPTPMPPLNWQGYGGNARPTYSTWRDWYHKNVGQ